MKSGVYILQSDFNKHLDYYKELSTTSLVSLRVPLRRSFFAKHQFRQRNDWSFVYIDHHVEINATTSVDTIL